MGENCGVQSRQVSAPPFDASRLHNRDPLIFLGGWWAISCDQSVGRQRHRSPAGCKRNSNHLKGGMEPSRVVVFECVTSLEKGEFKWLFISPVRKWSSPSSSSSSFCGLMLENSRALFEHIWWMSSEFKHGSEACQRCGSGVTAITSWTPSVEDFAACDGEKVKNRKTRLMSIPVSWSHFLLIPAVISG